MAKVMPVKRGESPNRAQNSSTGGLRGAQLQLGTEPCHIPVVAGDAAAVALELLTPLCHCPPLHQIRAAATDGGFPISSIQVLAKDYLRNLPRITSGKQSPT